MSRVLGKAPGSGDYVLQFTKNSANADNYFGHHTFAKFSKQKLLKKTNKQICFKRKREPKGLMQW